VLVASTNEIHLEAFRQHPEYNSFRARLLPLRAGYLLDYKREHEIYDLQIVPQLRQHVAPHATHVAALWAVLTRLLPSKAERYDDAALGKIAADLTPMEKARLYAEGTIPRRLSTEQSKVLRAGLADLAHEFETQPEYEGLTGASAREIPRGVARCQPAPATRVLVSARRVRIKSKCCARTVTTSSCSTSRKSGYHDYHDFLKQVQKAWLELLDREVRTSTGLVEESRYEELFEKYITHVSLWLKGERYRDPITGDQSDPDQTLLKRVETILEVKNTRSFGAT